MTARQKTDCVNAALARAIMATSEAPIVVLSQNGEIIEFNQACETITGYAASEAVGRKVWDFLLLPDEIDDVRAVFEKTRSDGLPTHFTNSWRTKTGGSRLIEWTNTSIDDNNGGVACVLATGIDVTDVKRHEQALHESKAFLQSIINASPVAVVTINNSGEVITFSRAAERTFGYSEEEIRGRNIRLVMPEPDRSQHDQYMKDYRETGCVRIIGSARETRALRKNGETFPAILHVSEFVNCEQIFVGFIEDIADRRATESRLAETQSQLQHTGRLAAMGEIAASIAHELNQPLTAAASLAGAVSLELRKHDARDYGEVGEMLDDVVSEVRRASEIIRQMRDFIRKRKTAKSLHNINAVIEDAAAIALLGVETSGVRVLRRFDENLGEALLDRIQLQQVVINLIRNAIDAMENVPFRELTISTDRRDDLIEIKVADTGCGIMPDLADRLFDPFVTTKDDGMGIGLSISKSIIEAHGGRISAEPNTPRGSVFIIRVPIAGNLEATAGHRP